jgi:hypothetical protein
MRRSKRFLVILAAIAGADISSAGEVLAEERVKAGFISNFVQFTRWPGNPSSITLCSLENGREADPLSYLKDLNHRAPALVVRRLKTLGELHGCQALYLDSANAAKLPAVLGASAKRPLLIITDFDAGAMQGAAVSLVATGSGRFGFDVNLKAARSVGLDFNARLLQLARKVF